MTGLLFWILAGIMAALVSVFTVRGLAGRQRMIFAILFPLMSLGVYFMLGNPAVPSAPAVLRPKFLMAAEEARLLAAKPMQTLAKNPEDIGALIVMGDLGLRLHEKEAAGNFYKRAAAAAEKAQDPRLPLIRAKLKKSGTDS